MEGAGSLLRRRVKLRRHATHITSKGLNAVTPCCNVCAIFRAVYDYARLFLAWDAILNVIVLELINRKLYSPSGVNLRRYFKLSIKRTLLKWSYLGFKSYELEYTLQKKNCGEANVEAIKHSSVQFRFLVILTKETSPQINQT